MLRPILIPLLSATLGACVSQGPAPITTGSLETPVRAAFASATTDGQILLRLPPAAGPIQRVRSNTFANGFHQVVEFGGAASGMKPNAIDLRLQTQANVTAIEPLAIERPTEAMIRAELAAQFPKMDMKIVDQPRRNAAGPYGLGVGRWDNGTRCIYAWQWIDQPRIADAPTTYDAAVLRIRLCDSNVTLDQLATVIDEMQLAATPFAPAPVVTAQKPETTVVKPKPRRVVERPQPRPSIPTRHAAWDSTALNSTPVIQASERSADQAPATLDPTLPAEAFRGPAATRKTSK